MYYAATQNLYTDKRGFMILATLCVFLFSIYTYLVCASVVHVVIRTEITQDSRYIASEISTLETKYIEAQHQVSSDIATLAGYKKTAQKIFIDRTSDSLVLGTAAIR